MLNAKIADNGHLQFVLEDGSIVDAGNVRGPVGPQGDKGVGIKGDPGEPGKDGKDGNSSGVYLISTNATGDEGGEIQLAKPPNGTLSGGVTIDVYQNRLRIFEQGGTARGAYIDLTTAAAGVGTNLIPPGLKGYAAGYVDAGTFVTLDNLKFSVTTSGQRGLCCATVSGTVTLSISSSYSVVGGASGSSTSYPGGTYTTTPSGSWFGYHFPNAGDGSVYLVNDYTNQRFYRVTLMIGYAYTKNFISIERLG